MLLSGVKGKDLENPLGTFFSKVRGWHRKGATFKRSSLKWVHTVGGSRLMKNPVGIRRLGAQAYGTEGFLNKLLAMSLYGVF
jgi:hypothetical protein